MDQLIIGNQSFNVGFLSLSRNFEIAEKYRVQTDDGNYHREIRGVYANFALTIGNVDPDEYDRLMNTLLSTEESQLVTVPYGKNGTLTFAAAFDGISDTLILENDEGTVWDELTVTFTAFTPKGGTK